MNQISALIADEQLNGLVINMKEMIARVGDRINKDGIESVCLTTKEVVRCKDCKYAEVIPPFVICRSHITRSMNWFCADGEQK